jgi:hypothetical protein
MFFFVEDNCPVCRTGFLGIRCCSDGQTLVVMCDECETIWASPENISRSNALDAEPPMFEVVELGIAIAGGSAKWASCEQITAKGWEMYVKGEQTNM